jgi:uncharacterized iron-regulated protein
MTSRFLSLALALAAACTPRADPRLVHQPIAERTWVSSRHRDHPLVGKIWDGRAGRFVDEGALVAAVAAADLLLLGEVHDNPDHHLLQARVVRAAIAAGRRPALAFEMLSTEQQPAVDAALARAPGDPDAFAEAVAWEKSGWPPFALYRPIFAAGLEAGLPVVGANLPRTAVKTLVSKGVEALDAPLRERLARGEPVPPDQLEEMRAEMRESHCNELPEALIDPLVVAQRARDATMAARLAEADAGRGAILVTGNGHARTDRGVPAFLAEDAPGRAVLSVAFMEVVPERTDPAAYAKEFGAATLPFDFAVFTAGTEREDMCAALRAHPRRSPPPAEKREAPGEPAPAAPPEAPDTATDRR